MEEIVEAASAGHKLLMRIFVRSLEKMVHPPNPYSVALKVVAVCMDEGKIGALLALRQRVRSILLRDILDYRLLPLPIAADQIVAALRTLTPESRVICINLSENSLVDADLAAMWTSLRDIMSTLGPLAVILQLDHNRFIYPDAVILEIIQCPAIRFIDVAQTPFSSHDRRDFFLHKISEGVLSKLIFIPFVCLESAASGWRALLPEACDEDLILKTHREYYANTQYFGVG